jgi:predicted nuclease with RNAse H fold
MLNDGMHIEDARVWLADELPGLINALSNCSVVAIDSPDRWSAGPRPEHSTLSPKFQSARCAEIGLGVSAGYWVPWTTPLRPTTDDQQLRFAWMAHGIALFEAVRSVTDAIEVYPNAIFRRLAGTEPLAKKTSPLGLRMRIDLLRRKGVSDFHIEMWSHDATDAAATAVTAMGRAQGLAEALTCGHDGSAMWLPQAGL